MAKKMYSTSWGRTSKAFSSVLLDAGKRMSAFGKDLLVQGSEDWLRKVDSEWPHESVISKGTIVTNVFGGDKDHPWYYGQLHDSIAVRLSQGTTAYAIRYMPPKATIPQHMGSITNIIGAEWATSASRSIPSVSAGSRALKVSMFIGVPYAQKVNESSRHAGYADALYSDLYRTIRELMATKAVKKRIYMEK